MDPGRALVEQGQLLAETISDVDHTTPVPACPGWTLRQLVTHVGRGDRWAAAVIDTGRPVQFRDVPDGRAPDDPDGIADWLRDGAQLLIDNAAQDPSREVWTFLGPRPAPWWVRRRLHESTVHRADAATALGVPYVIEPELAADGVSELLALLTERKGDGPAPLASGSSLHLHATDSDGEWVIRGTDAGVTWEHGHVKATTAVRGPTADLLLACSRRLPADHPGIEVLGDPAIWATWWERTAF